MAWRTPTNTEIDALIGPRGNVERSGIVVGAITVAGPREAVA
jgi:hypothetical protein